MLFPFDQIDWLIAWERRRRLRGPLGHAATRIMNVTPWLTHRERVQVARSVVLELREAFLCGVALGASGMVACFIFLVIVI